MSSRSKNFKALILPSSSTNSRRIAQQIADYPFLPKFSVNSLPSCILASSEDILKFADIVVKFPGVESVLIGRETKNMDEAVSGVKDMITKMASKRDTYAVTVRCLDQGCNETDISIILISKCIDVLSPLGFRLNERNPRINVNVAVSRNFLFISYIQKKGLGGREFASMGKAVIMFKGDVNGLLAALSLLRLGFIPILVTAIDLKRASGVIRQIIANACLVREHVPIKEFYLYLVPVQVDGLSSEIEVHHRFLREIGESIALDNSAVAIATGIDIDNAAPSVLSVYHKSKLAVLHPLLCMTKQEISRTAFDYFSGLVKSLTSNPLEKGKVIKEMQEEDLIGAASNSVQSLIPVRLTDRSSYNLAIDEAIEKIEAAMKKI